MQTSELEEKDLTEQGSDPEQVPETWEQSPATQEAAPEQEITTLVPIEPEVIEGEIIAIEQPDTIDVHMLQKQKPYWLLIPLTILLCLLLLAASFLLPLLTPTATITVIPIERTITATTAIKVQARALVPLTLSQSATVPATGKQRQAATRAEGSITFYNGLLTSQTVAAGTILIGSDGIHVITEQPATNPAANPPLEGQVTVSAHAVSTGARGNIPAYDINQACCAISVLAKNTTAFSGGSKARAYSVIRKSDLASAQEAIQTTLAKSEQAALTTQLNPDEALIAPPCKPVVSSNHKPGDEAIQVTVTVSDTCTGFAYAAHDVYASATQMITKDAVKRLGTSYKPIGDIQTTIIQATVPSTHQGKAQIFVQATGIWAYRLTPRIQEQLARLIAGKTVQRAKATLLHFPGIAGVLITVRGGDTTLPQDAQAIRILVWYTIDQMQMPVSSLTREEG